MQVNCKTFAPCPHPGAQAALPHANAVLSAPSPAHVVAVTWRSPRLRRCARTHIFHELIVCCDPAVKLHINYDTVVISPYNPSKFGRQLPLERTQH